MKPEKLIKMAQLAVKTANISAPEVLASGAAGAGVGAGLGLAYSGGRRLMRNASGNAGAASQENSDMLRTTGYMSALGGTGGALRSAVKQHLASSR